MSQLALAAGVVGGRTVVVERHDGDAEVVVVDDVRFDRRSGRVTGTLDDGAGIDRWEVSDGALGSLGRDAVVEEAELLSLSWSTTALGAWCRLLAPGLEPTTSQLGALERGVATLELREATGGVRALALSWRTRRAGLRFGGTTITYDTDGEVALRIELGDWGRGTPVGHGVVVVTGSLVDLRVGSPLNWLEGLTRRLVPDGDASPLIAGRVGAVAAVDDAAVLVEFDLSGDGAAPSFLPAVAIEAVDDDVPARSLPLLRSPSNGQELWWGGRPGRFTVELVTAARDERGALRPDAGVQLPLRCTTQLAGRDGAVTDGGRPTRHQTLAVEDDVGLRLHAPDGSSTVEFAFGGFDWVVDGNGDSPLVLTTAPGETSIVLGPSATATLAYRHLGDEPVRFVVERFVVTDGGLDVDATVVDEPVTLAGIATAFRFDEGSVRIRGGQLQDFQLLGSGPLPPDLVGEASAAIALQFTPEGGRATLDGAGATLTTTGAMLGTAVPFAFDLSAIGLGHELIDGTYHFYFTLTGEAVFAPGPDFPVDHPLADLDAARIALDAAPLAGDLSALLSRMSFAIELATPATFDFLGCFTMEVEEVSLLGQVEVLDGAPGIELAGRLRFAVGEGDKRRSAESRHRLVVGPPAPGEWVPRIHVAEVGVTIQQGEAFTLDASVTFEDTADRQGFTGEGTIEIQGLPSLAVAVSFVRVRRPADDEGPERWHRAWFIAVNVGRLTLRVPYVNIFIREVGLGFGYRYTLTSFAAADDSTTLAGLLAALREASRTQGDLADPTAWQVSLEPRGADPRWTIALRALMTQHASPRSTPLRLHDRSEERLANAFLFDVLAAVRSDLTILMTARMWLNTNYLDYVGDSDVAGRPLFSGFALVQPSHQRFIAQVSSNPDGHMGSRPPLPTFLADALRSSHIAATVLVEPNLVHAELGWPNGLRTSMRIGGVVDVQMEAGAIYRIASLGAGQHHLVIGISIRARASMSFRESIDLGIAGASVVARASASFGARFIAAAQLGSGDGSDSLDVYGGVSVDIRVAVEIHAWIGFDLGIFGEIKKHFHFALELGFSASLEFGFRAAASGTRMGFQGRGTLLVRVCGRSFEFDVEVAHGGGTVLDARRATARYMSIGLEAGDGPAALDQPTDPAAAPPAGEDDAVSGAAPPVPSLAAGRPSSSTALAGSGVAHAVAAVPLVTDRLATPPPSADEAVVPAAMMALLVRPDERDPDTYVVLYPGDGDGFLPNHPPLVVDAGSGERVVSTTTAGGAPIVDFELDLGALPEGLEHWDPVVGDWVAVADARHSWRGDWSPQLATMVDAAFVDGDDPPPPPAGDGLRDGRVTEPSDADYEAAIRGTVDELRRSPMFRPDPKAAYEQRLRAAFSPDTDVYRRPEERRARQLRGMLVQQLIGDLEDWREDPTAFAADRVLGDERSSRLDTSPLFRLGLVFRIRAEHAPAGPGSGWPGDADGASAPTIAQRVGTGEELAAPTRITLFNPTGADFVSNPPVFEDVHEFTDSSMVAFGWRLRWTAPSGATGAAADVEHHLAHYEVRRRTLVDGGQDQVVVTTMKPADTLAYGGTTVDVLRRRFELVDSFEEEGTTGSPLPAHGRTYVYTVTPVDVTGGRGRSLTLVATRRPTTPPLVPTDAVLTVCYDVAPERLAALYDERVAGDTAARRSDGPVPPVEPAAVELAWTPPTPRPGHPHVVVDPEDGHQLVFRRRGVLPVGSYGLDTATNGADRRDLPSSAARLRGDDVVLPLGDVDEGDQRWSATVDLEELRRAGVFPQAEWRPDAWQVFVRTVSEAGVPSALVAVELMLRFVDDDVTVAERRPAELEWPTAPIALPVLDRQDCIASAGRLHLPTPTADGGEVSTVFAATDERVVRVRWNQAPSTGAGYQSGLTAGFHVYRIDVDATTADVLADPDGLRRHAVLLDEVRLQDPATAALEPRDTSTPAQWQVRHLSPPGQPLTEPALDWPVVDAAVDGLLHPALARVVDVLELPADDLGSADASPDLVVGVDHGRPVDTGTWGAVHQAFAPGVDPVGWGLLGFLGLGVTLGARERLTNRTVDGAELRRRVALAVAAVVAEGGANASALADHLVVTSLYQPQAARRVEPGPDDTGALLAVLHLALRPRRVDRDGEPGRDVVGRDGLAALLGRVVPAGAPLRVPAADDLPVSWFQRFLDHAPAGVDAWTATAVPRQSAPRRAIPDARGRVHLDDHVADGYAHAFRYLVRPYSRYDRLWRGVAEAVTVVAPDGSTGGTRPLELDPERRHGADAALDRVAPLAAPTIVSSTWVPQPTTEGPSPGADPAADGVWEVVVATHPEQVLSEQNRTVARRLDHRQVVHTLTRAFLHTDGAVAVGWDALDPPPRADATRAPALPAVPTTLAHVDLGEAGSSGPLSVIARVGDPARQATILQVPGVPFYYEHTLHLVAQSSHVASPVASVTQRDFGYRTPEPKASIAVAVDEGDDALPTRIVTVSLACLWDSLTAAAQRHWPDERPPATGDGALVPGAVPDPGVVYEVIYVRSGTVQPIAVVQFEPGTGAEDTGAWRVRQVGELFRVSGRPALVRPPGATRRSSLGVAMEVEYRGPRADEEAGGEGGGQPPHVAVPVPRVPDGLPAGIVPREGPGHLAAFAPVAALDEAARARVLPSVRDAHQRLVALSTGRRAGAPVSAPLPRDGLVPGLDRLRWGIDEAGEAVTGLLWSGAMASTERASLVDAVRGTDLADAVTRLLAAVDEDRPEDRIAPSLRDLLPGSLVVGDAIVSWTPPPVAPPVEQPEEGETDEGGTDEATGGADEAARSVAREQMAAAVAVADELSATSDRLVTWRDQGLRRIDDMRELLARLEAALRADEPRPDVRREIAIVDAEAELLVPRLVPHGLERHVEVSDDPWAPWVVVKEAGDVADELVDELTAFGDPDLRETIARLLAEEHTVEDVGVRLVPDGSFHTEHRLETSDPVGTEVRDGLTTGLAATDPLHRGLDALYDAAMALGLGGGELRVRARRGVAGARGPVDVLPGALPTRREDGGQA